MRNEDKGQAFESALYTWARSNEERDAQRITSDEIASLKLADHRARSTFTIATVFTALFRDISAVIAGLFHVTSKKFPMCDNYGHIADVAKWKEHLPECSDCGAKITARSQLRKAVPHR